MDVWCAWGSIIEKRSYLKSCLNDIVEMIMLLAGEKQLAFLRKKMVDGTRNNYHPLHPVASVKTDGLEKFDLRGYINLPHKEVGK